jgi:hypothetical protein
MEQRNEVGEPLRKKNGVGLVKAKTTQELSEEYQISRETFRNWIEPFLCEIGPRKGNIFNIRQVSIIYEKLGKP